MSSRINMKEVSVKSVLSRALSRRLKATSPLARSSTSATTTPDVVTRAELDLTLPCATSDSPLRATNTGRWICHVSQTPGAMLLKVTETIRAMPELPQPSPSLTPAAEHTTPSSATAAGWTARRTLRTGADATDADPDATLHGLSLTSPPLHASADYAAIDAVCLALRTQLVLLPDADARARVHIVQTQHGGQALVSLKRALTLLWFAEPLLFRLAGASRDAGACLARASNAATLPADVAVRSRVMEALLPPGVVGVMPESLTRLWAARSLVEMQWLLAGEETAVGLMPGEHEGEIVLTLAHLRCSWAVERPGLVAQWTKLCHWLVEAGTAWPDARFKGVVKGMLTHRMDPLDLVAAVADGRMDHVVFWQAELARTAAGKIVL